MVPRKSPMRTRNKFPYQVLRTPMVEEARFIKNLFQTGVLEAWVWNTDHYEPHTIKELRDWAKSKVGNADPSKSTLNVLPPGSVLLLVRGRRVRAIN